MAACFAALLRGEDSEAAEAALLTLADMLHEMRCLRQAMTGNKAV